MFAALFIIKGAYQIATIDSSEASNRSFVYFGDLHTVKMALICKYDNNNNKSK